MFHQGNKEVRWWMSKDPSLDNGIRWCTKPLDEIETSGENSAQMIRKIQEAVEEGVRNHIHGANMSPCVNEDKPITIR